MNPESLPLTHHLKHFLGTADAMPQGGYLGIHLVHAYPHTHKGVYRFVPAMLKGADMAAYQAVITAGLHGRLAPLRQEDGLPTIDTLPSLAALARSHPGPRGVVESCFEAILINFQQEDSEEEYWDYDGGVPTDEEAEEDDDAFSRDGETKRDCFGEDTRCADRKILWLNHVGNEEISKVFLAVSTCETRSPNP
jgi:hypothetical protein